MHGSHPKIHHQLMQREWLFWCSLDFNVAKRCMKASRTLFFSLCCKHSFRGKSLKCWDLRWQVLKPPWGSTEKPQVSESVCSWLNPPEHQTVCWQTEWRNKSALFKRRYCVEFMIQTYMSWKRSFASQFVTVRGMAMKIPNCVICKTLPSPPKGKKWSPEEREHGRFPDNTSRVI